MSNTLLIFSIEFKNMNINRSLFLLVLIAIILSSCALNKIFLVPTKLDESVTYSRYVEKYADTLTLSFNADRSPAITDSKDQLVDLPFTIESIFFKNRNEYKIHSWFMKPKENYNGVTIYFLHGNAGNMAYQYG